MTDEARTLADWINDPQLTQRSDSPDSPILDDAPPFDPLTVYVEGAEPGDVL
ncbi:MAG: hypothetical protein IH942_05290, partial [Acidobacteria bacterium]|nr:hypothetical protein [Acidobacteriota bacterium]